jgi:hypothetical protein
MLARTQHGIIQSAMARLLFGLLRRGRSAFDPFVVTTPTTATKTIFRRKSLRGQNHAEFAGGTAAA